MTQATTSGLPSAFARWLDALTGYPIGRRVGTFTPARRLHGSAPGAATA
ncbi:MAG: hypothetical protein H6Q90_893 [Deltaproteobacteria bacterium]|nr:hypothetical protein [Deltaproteobacteria bacterium]